MAWYPYKRALEYIPEEIYEEFEKEYGREADDDPNYNGDLWLVAAMYMDKLVKENEELKEQLKKNLQREGMNELYRIQSNPR